MDLVRFVNHAYASSLRATAPILDKYLHYECGSSNACQRTDASGGISSQISDGKIGQWCQKPDQSIGFLSARVSRSDPARSAMVRATFKMRS